jgi:hypothetical protein
LLLMLRRSSSALPTPRVFFCFWLSASRWLGDFSPAYEKDQMLVVACKRKRFSLYWFPTVL